MALREALVLSLARIMLRLTLRVFSGFSPVGYSSPHRLWVSKTWG